MLNLSEKTTPFRKHFLPLCFVIVSISLIYSNTLKGEFVFDDSQIKERTNLHIKDLSFESIKNTLYFTPYKQRIYRPLPGLTLAFNYYFGKDDPLGYHIVNIIIHILCSISVYIFLHVLLSIPGLRPTFVAKHRYELAVIATFLFALHPLQTNVATYIIQRMTSLAALFYIISVTGYFIFRINTLPGKENYSIKRYIGLIIFIISGICALLSKENTAVLPITILTADYLLFFQNATRHQKEKLIRIYIISLIVLLTLFMVFGLKKLLLNMGGGDRFTTIHRDFTPIERLLTESRVVFFYLYLLIIPNISSLNLNHDFFISKNIFDPPQTFIAIIGIVVLVTIAYLFRKKLNLVSFAIAWFFINLVIESTILPLEIIFEHRTYLPGVMIFLIISFGIVYTSKNLLKTDNLILVTSLALILFAHGTYLRNFVYSNQISVWIDVVEKSPNLARAHANLGKVYNDHGFLMKAHEEYQKAIELKPDMVEVLVNLSTYNGMTLNRLDIALDLAKKAMIPDPRSAIAPEKLADVYMRLKNYKKAEHFYDLAVKRQRFFSNAINGLGVAKIRLGKMNEAIKVLEYGIRIDPSFEIFYTNLAKLYADEERFSDAIILLEEYPSKYKDVKGVFVLLEHIKQKSKAAERTKEY